MRRSPRPTLPRGVTAGRRTLLRALRWRPTPRRRLRVRRCADRRRNRPAQSPIGAAGLLDRSRGPSAGAIRRRRPRVRRPAHSRATTALSSRSSANDPHSVDRSGLIGGGLIAGASGSLGGLCSAFGCPAFGCSTFGALGAAGLPPSVTPSSGDRTSRSWFVSVVSVMSSCLFSLRSRLVRLSAFRTRCRRSRFARGDVPRVAFAVVPQQVGEQHPVGDEGLPNIFSRCLAVLARLVDPVCTAVLLDDLRMID